MNILEIASHNALLSITIMLKRWNPTSVDMCGSGCVYGCCESQFESFAFRTISSYSSLDNKMPIHWTLFGFLSFFFTFKAKICLCVLVHFVRIEFLLRVFKEARS